MGTQILVRGSMKLTTHADPGCDFCAIAHAEEDARVIFRTESVLAFFPLEPATLGHTLLVPRKHVQYIWDADVELARELGEQTLRLAKAIRDVVHPDGLNVIQSNGGAATQTVPHVHFHIVPRWNNDTFGPIWPPQTNYSERQKDSAWEALRTYFSPNTQSSPKTTPA